MKRYRIKAFYPVEVAGVFGGEAERSRIELRAGGERSDVVRIERVSRELRVHHFGVPHPEEAGKPVIFVGLLEIELLG